MPDDDREQPEVDAERHERGPQRDACDHARKRDGEDQEERDRLPAEEVVALDGDRGERAEDECERRRRRGDDERVDHGLTDRGVRRRLTEPAECDPRGRPRLDAAGVERVDGQDHERQVEEHQHAAGGKAERDPRDRRFLHRSVLTATRMRPGAGRPADRWS